MRKARGQAKRAGPNRSAQGRRKVTRGAEGARHEIVAREEQGGGLREVAMELRERASRRPVVTATVVAIVGVSAASVFGAGEVAVGAAIGYAAYRALRRRLRRAARARVIEGDGRGRHGVRRAPQPG